MPGVIGFKQSYWRKAHCTFCLDALQRASRGAYSEGQACHVNACIACSGAVCRSILILHRLQGQQRSAVQPASARTDEVSSPSCPCLPSLYW